MTTDAAITHGLLLVSIPDLEAPLSDTFHAIQRALVLVHRLTIVVSVQPPQVSTLIPPAHNGHSTGTNNVHGSATGSSSALSSSSLSSSSTSSRSSPGSFHSVQRLLSALYVSFTKQAMALDRPLAEVDVVFRESCGYAIGAGVQDEIPFQVLLGLPPVIKDLQELNRTRKENGANELAIFTLDLTPETQVHEHLAEAVEAAVAVGHAEVEEGAYEDVALGGTFDHLHAGHKILLSMTAWITSHRVVCGVTDDSMLKTKKFKEFMEPLDKRVKAVERFLRVFKRGLIYEVVPIHDIYGPTITDNKLEALMVSKETLKGGAAVNQERTNRDLPPLAIEVINVISPTETQVDEVSLKISSTFIRQYLAERAPVTTTLQASAVETK